MTGLLTFFRRPLALALAALSLFAAACLPPPDPTVSTRSVMGSSALTWEQLAWFFNANKPANAPLLTTSINEVAAHFIWEGGLEGVKGDIAFAQSIIETGWFTYGGQVQWEQNNFAGIGATDGGAAGATFENAQLGVRAQIQHLRAYADPTARRCEEPPLHAPCVDPRFHLVSPKGKASSWDQMGNGNWATDPDYAAKVINLYNEMRAFAYQPPI